MVNFLYDTEWASDYQLKVCSFESKSGINITEMGSKFSDEHIKITGTDEFKIINNDYSSPLSFVFQTCKFDNDCTLAAITPEEYSKINRWVNRKESHRFKIDKTNYQDIYFLGRFNINAIKINDDIYGIEFTFISDYPYGFLDEITQTYSGKNFMIYNHSDEIGFLYPKITINCKESGDLRIENSMDNEIFELLNCQKNEIINIDSKYAIINSSKTGIPLYNRFNFNYIKLSNTYLERKNIFTSSLNIDMTISYSPIKKVGI